MRADKVTRAAGLLLGHPTERSILDSAGRQLDIFAPIG
jgi:hypothetical protein